MSTSSIEVLALSSHSKKEMDRHASIMLDLEAKKAGRTIVVPTLVDEVKAKLRSLGEPIRLFGENLADVRERLRTCLGKIKVLAQNAGQTGEDSMDVDEDSTPTQTQRRELVYTEAGKELIEARKKIVLFSATKAKERLALERERRSKTRKRLLDEDTSLSSSHSAPPMPTLTEVKKANPTLTTTAAIAKFNDLLEQWEAKQGLEDEFFYLKRKNVIGGITSEEDYARSLYTNCKGFGLDASEFCDNRFLTTAIFGRDGIVATAGWTGVVKHWRHDTTSQTFKCEKEWKDGHEDRITGMAFAPDGVGLATASLDGKALVWSASGEKTKLEGHKKRLCKIAWHPTGDYVGTTSADLTWRLWQAETGKEILLQDGHFSEAYGIDFHGDGSLVATTDFGGAVHVWDLRSGKNIQHFQGHSKRVLSASWSGNGFELATGGDDGTVKIWDLRAKKVKETVPAHAGLISCVKFSPSSSEVLLTSSYDGKVKIFNTRNWKCIKTLVGHSGQVTSVDMNAKEDTIVSSGFDKTFKIWRW